MPYSSLSEARIKKLDGVPLTLAQVNAIAAHADGIPEGEVDSPWAVAISSFKKTHTKKNNRWVKKKKSQTREKQGVAACVCPECGYEMEHERGSPCAGEKCPKCGAALGPKLEKESEVDTYITDEYVEVMGVRYPRGDKFDGVTAVKELDDGTYDIVVVSTAALEDREGETYDIECIDYDLKEAKRTGVYPEFRIWHKKYLSFGKVTDMQRVGIFAVDRGRSYDDSFSLSVCKDMLVGNDGTWKASRGFKLIEVSGLCPDCGENLLLRKKHMAFGFRCPSCGSVHLGYKSVLDDVRFKKARTFDVTITDIPAVPWTSAAAFRRSMGDMQMTKKELKKKLLAAGISEGVIDSRLKDVDEELLKEFEELPMADVLKELKIEDEDDGSDAALLYLDPKTLKEFNETVQVVVRKEVAKAFEKVEIQIPDVELDIPELEAMKESLDEILTMLKELITDDEKRLKEMLQDAPRAARLRLRRYKAVDDDEEDEEDEEEEELEELEKELLGAVVSGTGKKFESMSDFVMSREK